MLIPILGGLVVLQFMVILHLISQNGHTGAFRSKLNVPQQGCPVPFQIALNSTTVTGNDGVAVTLFLGAPKWFQNRYTLMINQVLVNLPEKWVVQIFYIPNNKMSSQAITFPGLQRQIAKGRVILTPIPAEKSKIKKKDLLMSMWLWQSMLAEKVLLFGGNSAICSNSPHQLADFLKFDYIGGPWQEFEGLGGDGGLSLRSRTEVLAMLARLAGSEGGGVGVVKSKGREDSVLVEELVSRSFSRIASKQDTIKFAMSNHIAAGSPFGVIGTLSSLNDTARQQYIDYCPEMKMMLPSLHNPACYGAEPSAGECFKYLCEAGGLKCKRNVTLSWVDKHHYEVQLSLSVS